MQDEQNNIVDGAEEVKPNVVPQEGQEGATVDETTEVV